MKLICELNESVEILHEGVGTNRNYFIRGVFLQGDIKNRNGRVYPMNVLEREVNRYIKTYVEQNRALGELGHPDGPSINLDRVSHKIVELYKDGANYVGKAKVMETPFGKIVKCLIDESVRLGVSSRGMGTLRELHNGEQEVQDDFYLSTAADIVADPSAPDAFVQGIMEGKEWVWDNGIIKEQRVASLKRELDRKFNEKAAVDAFSSFMEDLRKTRSNRT